MQIKPFLNHFLKANGKKHHRIQTKVKILNQESIQGIMNTRIK